MKTCRTFLVLLIVLTASFARAQHNLIPGYIVKNNQDTLYGFLKYERDAKLSKRVLFFNDKLGKEPTVFTPSEIKEFSFSTKRTFMSVQSEKDTISVFAKKVLTGKINMYVSDIKGPAKFNIFLWRSDTSLMAELSNPKKSIVQQDSKLYSYISKKYIRQIAFLTDDLEKGEKLKSLKYKEADIKKYLDSYNDGFKDIYPASVYKDSTRLTFDILAGLPFHIKPAETSFRFSAYADWCFVESMPNFSYRAGVSYRYFYSNEYPDINLNPHLQYFKEQMISILPLGTRFQFSTGRIVPYAYFLVGLSIFSEKDYFIYNNNYSIQQDSFFFLTSNIGAGVKFKIKSNYILAEITPVLSILEMGFMFNLGFSF